MEHVWKQEKQLTTVFVVFIKDSFGISSFTSEKPNNNSNLLFHPAIEAVITRNNSQREKNEQLQTPCESSAHDNDNKVTLNVASSKHIQYHLEAKNQDEPTTKVSDHFEEARRLMWYICVSLTNE